MSNGFYVKREFDYFSRREYLIHNRKSAFAKLASQSAAPVAQVGYHLALPLPSGSLAILRNHTLEDYGINLDYRFSIKTAEYHSYIDLHNIKTDQHLRFSIAPAVKSTVFGTVVLRNDDHYEAKYYKGFVYHPKAHEDYEWASHAVTWAINASQARDVVDYANAKREFWSHTKEHFSTFSVWNMWSWENHYPLTVDGQNCHDFVNELLLAVNISPEKSYSYLRYDEVNMLDRGVLYSYFQKNLYLNPLHIFKYVKSFFSVERFHFPNPEIEELFVMSQQGATEDILKEKVNKIDKEELTKLYNRGFTSAIIEAIKQGHTNLFTAIAHKPGVDLTIKNCNIDNIAQIAVYYERSDILQAIRTLNQGLLFEYNEHTQPPICTLEDCVNDPLYQKHLVQPHEEFLHAIVEPLPYI